MLFQLLSETEIEFKLLQLKIIISSRNCRPLSQTNPQLVWLTVSLQFLFIFTFEDHLHLHCCTAHPPKVSWTPLIWSQLGARKVPVPRSAERQSSLNRAFHCITESKFRVCSVRQKPKYIPKKVFAIKYHYSTGSGKKLSDKRMLQ